jgi:hypothetical protein
MLGPLLIGLVSQLFGLKTGFIACGVLGLITLALIAGRYGSDRKSAAR